MSATRRSQVRPMAAISSRPTSRIRIRALRPPQSSVFGRQAAVNRVGRGFVRAIKVAGTSGFCNTFSESAWAALHRSIGVCSGQYPSDPDEEKPCLGRDGLRDCSAKKDALCGEIPRNGMKCLTWRVSQPTPKGFASLGR